MELIIIILIVVGTLCLLGRRSLSAKSKGKIGELRVSEQLAKLPQDTYTILNDVVYRTGNGTTQIDHIVISKYGIFTIETKNYRGEIHGNDDKNEWKQIIKTDVTYQRNWWNTYTYITNNKLYNPIRQSLGHVTQIRKLLKSVGEIPIIPVVVFSDKADLSDVSSSYVVINLNELIACIESYHTTCIAESDLRKIRIILQDANVRDVVDDKTHVQNVQAAKEYHNAKIRNGICPRCGKPLVLRQGNYGSFYGCSGYPKCRFTTS